MTVFWGKTAVTVKQGKLTDEAEGKRVFFFCRELHVQIYHLQLSNNLPHVPRVTTQAEL